MTNKEIAEQLRSIARAEGLYTQNRKELFRLADELDPQRPEPGTLVWVRWNEAGLQTALVDADGKGVVFNDNSYLPWEVVIECVKPRVLAPDEVAVKVPPASEWPKEAESLHCDPWFANGGKRYMRHSSALTITRAEAERMEAER